MDEGSVTIFSLLGLMIAAVAFWVGIRFRSRQQVINFQRWEKYRNWAADQGAHIWGVKQRSNGSYTFNLQTGNIDTEAEYFPRQHKTVIHGANGVEHLQHQLDKWQPQDLFRSIAYAAGGTAPGHSGFSGHMRSKPLSGDEAEHKQAV